jgi:hypothetical protein
MTERRRDAAGARGGAHIVPPVRAPRQPPLVEAVLRVQRQAGNVATRVLLQRDWTQEQTDKVKAQMHGPDWNRDGGPWWLLNGHNPGGLAGILLRLGKARAELAAHPVDGSRYDKPRLDMAMAAAAAGGKSAAAQLSGMDAIRNMMAGRILADDRQALIEQGFLREGVTIRVHPYKSATPGPQKP